MNRNIEPFLIAIGPYTSGESYPVRATFAGKHAVSDLQLPDLVLDATADLLDYGEMALEDAEQFGRMLGRALFTARVRDLFLRSVKAATESGVRVQLQLQIAPPELVPLPWELITIGQERSWSPALRDDYGLVRVSRGGRMLSPLQVDGPIHILAAAVDGEEPQLEALEDALEKDLRTGRVMLHLLPDATPASLEHALRTAPIHILHCVAPVVLADRRTPQITLRRGMRAFDFADLLASARGLRLITLAEPQGELRAVTAALPNMAALLTADLPAAIAFAGPLPATLAARFAATCYARVAAGFPVDLAVVAGRRALGERGWGLVQLRLVPGCEQLFAVRHGMQAGTALKRLVPVMLVAAVLVLLCMLSGQALSALHMSAQANGPTLLVPSAGVSTPTAESSSFLKALFGGPKPTSTPVPTPLPSPVSYVTFSTAVSDTLEGIAQRMDSDSGAIATLNHLDPHVPLRSDYPLVIPIYRDGIANTPGLVVKRGNPANPKVALTFDIEIDDITLYGILDILRARGLHGTFFATGRWVLAYPDAARAIVREGHEICNHSLTHPYFSRIGLNGAENELVQTEQIIEKTTGVTSRPCFRFPYGDSTPDTLAVVARLGYVAYHWSADDAAINSWISWVSQRPAEANGGILLMHGRASTVANLPGWLDQLGALGLTPTTLTDTLR